MKRALLAAAVLSAALRIPAQVPVPFTTAEDRFLCFVNGRFEKLEPRPPTVVHAMESQLVYRDHQGQLKVFIPEGRRMHLLDRAGTDPVGTRKRIAWRSADTLKGISEGRARVLAVGVADFGVSDSLIVLHDTAMRELRVIHRRAVHAVATVERGSERPQWLLGPDALVFFNKEARRLSMYRRGKVRTLSDSTDVGIAVVGGGIIGWWDGHAREFKAIHGEQEHTLSDLRPASAQAGSGLIAFLDGNGRLQCFERGVKHRVLDEPPTAYWVKDSLLLYLDRGRLMLFQNGASLVVEPYVPEQWQVEGGLLAYLDINRELRGIEGGVRFRFGTEAAIDGFELFGDRVRYRSPLGMMVVATRRRNWIY